MIRMDETASKPLTIWDGTVLALAIVFPSVLTWFYFVHLADSPGGIQQVAYGLGKTLQFVLPVFWVGLVCRQRWLVRPFSLRTSLEGIGFGILVFGLMLALYWFWLRLPGEALSVDSAARAAILEKIDGLGLNFAALAIVGLFYSIVHSGLEEYYWRWFVFGRLSRYIPWLAAAFVSALGFMAHHVLLLGTYFGYGSPYCWLGSLAVAVGGLYWAWLYRRTDSIWGAWIGHGWIDAAIFGIGLLLYGESRG